MVVLFCIENDTPFSQQRLLERLYHTHARNAPFIRNSRTAETETFTPPEAKGSHRSGEICRAYAESHESDPAEIGDGFKELEEFLCELPLEDNNTVFNLCCRLCSAYERKAFLDGLQYGAHLMLELHK